jgi:hypothetical protein
LSCDGAVLPLAVCAVFPDFDDWVLLEPDELLLALAPAFTLALGETEFAASLADPIAPLAVDSVFPTAPLALDMAEPVACEAPLVSLDVSAPLLAEPLPPIDVPAAFTLPDALPEVELALPAKPVARLVVDWPRRSPDCRVPLSAPSD